MKGPYYRAIEEENWQEFVHTIDFWKEFLSECRENLESMKLAKQKRSIGGYMYCDIEAEFDPKCGKGCSSYDPCNGKNGKCRFLRNCFTDSGENYILYRSGKLEKEEMKC